MPESLWHGSDLQHISSVPVYTLMMIFFPQSRISIGDFIILCKMCKGQKVSQTYTKRLFYHLRTGEGKALYPSGQERGAQR